MLELTVVPLKPYRCVSSPVKHFLFTKVSFILIWSGHKNFHIESGFRPRQALQYFLNASSLAPVYLTKTLKSTSCLIIPPFINDY
jgi:hypothetical protein